MPRKIVNKMICRGRYYPEDKENKKRRSEDEEIIIDLDEFDNEDETDDEEDKSDNKDQDYQPSSSKKRKYTTLSTTRNDQPQTSCDIARADTEEATSQAMSENLNILNFPNNESNLNYEPPNKRLNSTPDIFKINRTIDLTASQTYEQTFEPTLRIFYKKEATDLDFVNEIRSDDIYKNLEVHRPKINKNSKIDYENTLVKFLENTENKEMSSFYLGEHNIDLIKIDNEIYDEIDNLDTFAYYIYETSMIYSAEYRYGLKMSSSYVNQQKKYFSSVDLYDRRFFVLIFDQFKNDSKSYLFKTDSNELTLASLRLFSSKNVKLVLNSVQEKKESNNITLKINIYLNEKNQFDELVEENPSFSLYNSKQTMDIHYLMTHFYLSRMDSSFRSNILSKDMIFEDLMDNDCLDDTQKKFRNENLFDLIYEIHKKNGSYNDLILCQDDSMIQELSCLRPNLRQYQINAIKWMLYKENFKFKKSSISASSDPNEKGEIHPLYVKIRNEKSDTIYYHKYFGVYTKQLPLKKKSLPGGILADEMGLGKTLEVLTLIMLNPRQDIFNQSFYVQIDKAKKELNKKSFSCMCGNTPNSFRAGKYQKSINDDNVYQCVGCSVWSHVKCLNYQGNKNEFLCLECCTKIPPISSGCTLIVTPSIISHQWAEEIKKHVNKKLNVLVYTGTQNGFIQPKDLAALDICITTYDVLSNELSHVFAVENMRVLRKAKRFMNIPSPLICVEWWRICLDEAQMVHSTNSRCAEMANRLTAINRWCVTGTPIGRSLADLHGLFTFIREDPYIDKKWFKYCLFETFRSGDKMPMANAVSSVLWRTAKKYVENQINIPKQTEKCYWLDFSPFESHLYQRVLETFRENRKTSFSNLDHNSHYNNINTVDQNNNQNEENILNSFFSRYSNRNSRLDEIDRSTIDQILSPILDLRLSCNHPQLVLRKRSFMAQNHHANKKEKLLTMEKSLEILMKKTQNECDNIFRLMAMHTNAIAGLHIINKNYDKAIDTYQKVLDSEKEYESNVKLDLIQKVHTYHNFIDILKIRLNSIKERDEIVNVDSIENTDMQIELLKRNLKECEKFYRQSFDDKKNEHEKDLIKKINELDKLIKNTFKDQSWWVDAISFIENSERSREFWDKLGSEFSVVSYFKTNNNIDESYTEEDEKISISYKICGKTAENYSELKLIFVNEFDNVIKYRDELKERLNNFTGNDISEDMVKKVADCHLRDLLQSHTTHSIKNSKCILCKSDNVFKTYARYLFSSSDDIIRLFSKTTNQNDESDNEETFANQQMQIKARSDLEKFFKLIINFCKNEPTLIQKISFGKEFLEFYSQLKEEFKLARQHWTNTSHLVNAIDELEMVKTRLRLLAPGEKNPHKLEYLIEPSTVNYHFATHTNEEKMCKINLSKKLGQLLYLKNSLKTFTLVDNQENTEPCPICQCNLGFEWYILSCGHLFCKECYVGLLESENSYILSDKRYVRCALCREGCSHDESHLVSTKKQEKEKIEEPQPIDLKIAQNNDYLLDNQINELKNIKIEGNCNSAKVEGIVKCLIKILKEDTHAKCLIFSEHLTMLELIIDLLKPNFISHIYVKDSTSLQKKIEDFKKNKNINVLLMPYSYGANGLNIIEATHVLLAEPTLNKSQEVQAIGRVHRIGQTKPTFVYRFMIKNTIEEHVYKMFKSNTTYSSDEPDFNQPMCSKEITHYEAQQKSTKKEESILTLNDIKNLFKEL